MAAESRPPASAALWGQLLRKNTLAAPSVVPLPPTAPLDRTGTSMRILLHDTQANFEKFSTKVDTLTSGINEAKREIVIVKDLFQRERESLTLDVVDLVNRSQTQIQKSIGEPAQASTVELFRKDVDGRLDGLTKRIDDMQSFNQTQSQALQNVAQALHSLQDQQGKILSALLPLLPLLHAVPVHIDSARSSINETMLKVESARVHRTPPHIWHQPPQVLRKRSFPTGPPSSPLLSRKRPRLEHEHINVTPKSASRDHSHGPPSRRPTLSANNRPYFLVGPGLAGPGRPPLHSHSHRIPSSAKPPSVPRRPLGDLPIPLESGQVSSSPPVIPRPLDSMPRPPPFLGDKGRLPLQPTTPQRPATPTPNPHPAPTSSPSPSNQPPAISTLPIAPTNSLSPTPLDPPAPLLPASSENPVQILRSAVAVELPVKVTMVRGRRSPFTADVLSR
ncbi:hypothetical protein B0H17DRAFT_395341 [Mycena rosella]|uniref:Uncharacterized protein n=1 Tax=Mycena rosella TaxID=1033263 RepID=A0AAD7CMJ4_MYCRO|nr:hypothetical protein B0H17DRAFT_395341 [Mycena rosella]